MTRAIKQQVAQLLNETPHTAVNPQPWEDEEWVADVSQHLQECVLLYSGFEDEMPPAQALGLLAALKVKYPQLRFDSRVEEQLGGAQ